MEEKAVNGYKLKTYADSYLFNNKIGRSEGENVADKSMKALKDYIIKATRIDKKSDAFRGIIEEVKRQQRSSIYYTILMLPNVELCIGPYELPRAFKVSDMKDVKNNGKPTIFIDVTGMVEMTKNGYYICKKIDVLCTYIIDAAIYLLYRYKTSKLLDNSNITITGTECYVSAFDYVVDYLRILGYSTNKTRIWYYIAKYYLVNVMGKDENDPYVNNIAAKVSGIDNRDLEAIRLFYIDGMYENIYTFVNAISESFKLKGLTLEVFIAKWAHCFGTGTQYATELFTSFLVLIANTYSASYVVNQKQVKRCCGDDNINRLFTEIEKAAKTSFDTGFFRENDEAYAIHSERAAKLLREKENYAEIINKEDFVDIGIVKAKAQAIKEKY
jgi:hypothetical protein